MSDTPHFSAMIEDQIKRWQGLRSQQKKVSPIIVLSREYGTGASAMGTQLATKLDFQLWDQKLLQAISENTGLSENILRSLDEHSRSKVEDLIAGVFLGKEGTETAYISQLYRVVHTIEKHGSGVIIGRGAQFIVSSEHAFRVRIVAPLEKRIDWVSQRESLDRKEAEKKVRKIDKERGEFHKRFFGKDANDPAYYDLVLNASTFPLEPATKVILASYRERFGI